MNLNFYDPSNANYLQSLQNSLNNSLEKLDQLRNISLNNGIQHEQPSTTNQEQRYYLDCGNREDWQQFLKLNYNITEKEIFEDYKLFLQAKMELKEDDNKEKLQTMKNRIANVDKGNKEYNKQSIKALNNYEPDNNNRTNGDEHSKAINNNKLAKNTSNNENKGVKYVR